MKIAHLCNRARNFNQKFMTVSILPHEEK